MSENNKESQPSKPTVSTLYYLLGCVAHHWRALGVQLKFNDSELDGIEADHKRCSSRLIELFDLWIERSPDCTWSTIVKALVDMGEKELARKVDHYTLELTRIEKKPFESFSNHCKRIVPMKEFCYEDSALEKVFFNCDQLSRTSLEYYRGQRIYEYELEWVTTR